MRRILFSIAFVVIIWLIIAYVFKPAQYLFPSPDRVLTVFNENRTHFIEHTLYTLVEMLIGFVIASMLGLSLAIVAVFYSRAESVLTTLSVILKTIPIMALAPLLILWFGPEIWSKVAAVVITCFMPILVNVLSGAKIIAKKYKDIISLYQMTKFQQLKKIILPGVAPYLLSALKISSSLAIVGALVSEFISANKGLGYLIISNYYSMNIAGVFVCIIISSILGLVIYYTIDFVEKKLITW